MKRIVLVVLGVLGTGVLARPGTADRVTIPVDGTPVRAELDPQWQPIGQTLTLEGPLTGWLSTDRVADVRTPEAAAQHILREHFTADERVRLAEALAQFTPLTPEQDRLCRDAATALWAWVATRVCVLRAVEISAAEGLDRTALDPPDPAIALMNGWGSWGQTLQQFGYGLCGSQSAQLVQLAQAAGFPAETRAITGTIQGRNDFHAIMEIGWGGQWHLFDPSLRFHVRRGPEQRVPSLREVLDTPALVARVRDSEGRAPRAPAMAAEHALYYEFSLSGGGPHNPQAPAPALHIPAGATLRLYDRSTTDELLRWGPAHGGSGRYQVTVEGLPEARVPSRVLWSHHCERRPADGGVALQPSFGRTGTVVYSVPVPYATNGGVIEIDADLPAGARLEVAASTVTHAAERVARYGTLDAAHPSWVFTQERDIWITERLRGGYGFAYRWMGLARDMDRVARWFFPTFRDQHVTEPLLHSTAWQILDPKNGTDGSTAYHFRGENAVPWPVAIRIQVRGARGRAVLLRRVELDARVQHAPQMHPFARGGTQTWRWTPEPTQESGGRIALDWPAPPPAPEPMQVTWDTTGPVPADGCGFVHAVATVRDASGTPVHGYVVRPRSARPAHDRLLPFARSPLPLGATPAGMYLDATDEDGMYTVHVHADAPGETRLWLKNAAGAPLPGEVVLRFTDAPDA